MRKRDPKTGKKPPLTMRVMALEWLEELEVAHRKEKAQKRKKPRKAGRKK